MLIQIFYNVLLFIFGGAIASFSAVVADRYGVMRIVNDRSRCLSCNRKLSYWENIPTISYLLLKGRCKTCKSYIPIGYFLLELFSGILFIYLFNIIFLWTNNITEIILLFIVFTLIYSLGIIISIYDMKHKFIMESALYILFALSFTVMAYRQYIDAVIGIDYINLFSGFIIATPFIILFTISRGGWLGLGDILLYIALGSLLPLQYSIYIFLYSIWIGSIVSIILLIIEKGKNMKSQIPFAPFIFSGLLLVFILKSDPLGIVEVFSLAI